MNLADAQSELQIAAVERQQLHETKLSNAELDERISMLRHEGQLKRRVEDAQADVEIDRMKDERELESTDKWLDIKAKKKAINRGDEAERLQIYSQADIRSLIATLPEAEAQRLLKLQEQEAAAGKSPEQLLAEAAASSPQAAAALEAMMRAKKDSLSDKERLYREHTDRLESLMSKALDAVAEASKRSNDGRGDNVNIYK